MPLALDYRPRSFDDLIGQEFVVRALTNAFMREKTVAGYLLHGGRGTGKTTSARILAKTFNCSDKAHVKATGRSCNVCDFCVAADKGEMVDIIEIDAASNAWVDDIRDLILNARYQPTLAQYKVYIIDEVHMLSKEAFNALLKTLEEPFPHVKFILATTEIEKVLGTILSRVQRYDFRQITIAEIVARLQYVADQEGIQTTPEALALVAQLARGGMRDALTMMEQYTTDEGLTLHTIQSRLGLIPTERLASFVATCFSSDHTDALEFLESVKTSGANVENILEQIIQSLRVHMRRTLQTPEFYRYSAMFDLAMDGYKSLKYVPESIIALELFTYRVLAGPAPESVSISISAPKVAPPRAPQPSPAPASIKHPASIEVVVPQAVAVNVSSPMVSRETTGTFSAPALVAKVQSTKGAVLLWHALKESRIRCEGDTIMIMPSASDMQRSQLMKAGALATIASLASELFGGTFQAVIDDGRGVSSTLAEVAGEIF